MLLLSNGQLRLFLYRVFTPIGGWDDFPIVPRQTLRLASSRLAALKTGLCSDYLGDLAPIKGNHVSALEP